MDSKTVLEMESVLWYGLLKEKGYRWWWPFNKPKIFCGTCGKEICCEKRLGLVFQVKGKNIPQCDDFHCIDEGYIKNLSED